MDHSGPAHIGIVLAFACKRALRPVARDEHRLIAHGPQALRDAVDQLLVVALGEVGAADAAGKQHVAHKSAVDLRCMKHHMARRVARAVAHVQRFVADLHLIAIVQPARGREMLRGRKTKHRALLRQPIDPELIARMGPDDGQRQPFGQLARATCVIDVRVGEPDLFEREVKTFYLSEQHLQVAAGVDHGGFVGGVAPYERAVLLERGDGDGEVAEHGMET